MILRAAYLIFAVPDGSPTNRHVDVWGDGVHFWLLSYLTAKNGFVYTDLKPEGLQLIWLPLHPLLTALVMRVTNLYSLDAIHSLNVIYGTLTGVAVYYVARTLWARDHLGFAAGLGLAFNAWWIATNTEGVVESLLALVTVLVLYFWMKGDYPKLLLLVFVVGFVKYEAWLITATVGIICLLRREFGIRRLVGFGLAWIAPVLAWSAWSWKLTGDPLHWYSLQRDALAWDVSLLGRPESPTALLYYPGLITGMTFGLFVIALIAGLKTKRAQNLLIVSLVYLLSRSIGYATGSHLPLERFVVILIPFTYLLAVKVLPSDLHLPKRRLLFAGALVAIITLPFVSSIWFIPKLGYIYNPQMRAALWLQQHYSDGLVVNDLPTVIGYSYPKPAPEDYLSTAVVYSEYTGHDASLRWLYTYFAEKRVKFFVWHYVPYSASWQLDEAEGSFLRLNAGKDSYFFKLVYVDTAANYWEHNYGVPDLYIFQIEYSDYWLQEGNLPN